VLFEGETEGVAGFEAFGDFLGLREGDGDGDGVRLG